jgi:hypothetical protein
LAYLPWINDTILGIIVGVILGFGSSIGSTFLIRWIARPKISINENTTEVKMNYKELDSDQVATMEEDEEPQHMPQTDFIATRIKVENKGMTAAKNCKASLIIGNNENRVGWMLRRDDSTVTINAYDSEYVDLCVISEFTNNEGRRIRFLTTEHGYGKSQKYGRPLPPGNIKEVVLKISAENAKGCSKKLWIADIPNELFKIVHFK